MRAAALVERVKYKDVFLYSLIFVSALPALVSLFNFEIFDRSIYSLVALFSIIAFLGGTHVWITLAYYFDKRWLAKFMQDPLIFLISPLAILAGSTLILIFAPIPIGAGFVYAAAVVNLWHHGKQNWGILSLIGKNRGIDVRSVRVPIVHAWPFFVLPLVLFFPHLTSTVDAGILRILAYGSVTIYIVFAGWAVIPSLPDLWRRDTIIFMFTVAILAYFLPLALLFGKPYALLFFGGAHALQYYLLVLASISLRSRQTLAPGSVVKALLVGLILIAGATALGASISQNWGDPKLWDSVLVRAVVGLTTGVSLVHFWIDAFIWKFSVKEVRELHGDAFVF